MRDFLNNNVMIVSNPNLLHDWVDFMRICHSVRREREKNEKLNYQQIRNKKERVLGEREEGER